MSNDYESKIDLIASKFLLEADLAQISFEFGRQNDWSINLRDI